MSRPPAGQDHGVDPADWLLTKPQRANASTRLDDLHPGDEAWSVGNLVRSLVHGATYFAELYERLEATGPGDLVLFTDWQGDADERLTGEPGSEVVEVLGRADQRGADVRGLVWRSHREAIGFTADENLRLGRQLQARGVEAILDMRVRTGGSHHQKMLVIRHGSDPSRDIAYVGGIDLCHSRRDDAAHHGDPQAQLLASEYGDRPPWHDVMAAISGPAVHDVETVFRERWEDPTRLSRSPVILIRDRLRGLDVHPGPLPTQKPPPPAAGEHVVQLLRTYPDLRHGRDYAFARGGERSVARGYTKALAAARRLVYVEDQYLWGEHVGATLSRALQRNPELLVLAVIPLHPDVEGPVSRTPQLLGRRRTMLAMAATAPDRFAVYGIENEAGTPIYVHAKACVVDDIWTSVGSDNFNRRSWTHDSELSAAVLDPTRAHGRALRLELAAEHLGRTGEDLSDLEDPAGMFAAYRSCAEALDGWYDAGRVGPRPTGRLRHLRVPELGAVAQRLAAVPYLLLHDPDGRPRPLRRRDAF
jgi:phosphatidylserine/phosphatidylglycerophosphate/cardiolipin synthase-like enzyme